MGRVNGVSVDDVVGDIVEDIDGHDRGMSVGEGLQLTESVREGRFRGG
jgi:hypothetical protein